MISHKHLPSDWGVGKKRCLYDHNLWPCDEAKVIAEAWREIAEVQRPDYPEPKGSFEGAEIEFTRWETRNDAADEIEERIQDFLNGKLHKDPTAEEASRG